MALCLGGEDGGMFFTFCGKDLCLLFTFCSFDVCLALAFGVKDHGALFTVRLHLHFHGLLDGWWRINGLEFDAADAQAPFGGGGI